MTAALLFKIAIFTILLIILVSLGSGMFFLVKDGSKSNRTVTSLTFRVILSIVLFMLLFVGFKTNLIQPHGLYPAQTEKAPRS